MNDTELLDWIQGGDVLSRWFLVKDEFYKPECRQDIRAAIRSAIGSWEPDATRHATQPPQGDDERLTTTKPNRM